MGYGLYTFGLFCVGVVMACLTAIIVGFTAGFLQDIKAWHERRRGAKK